MMIQMEENVHELFVIYQYVRYKDEEQINLNIDRDVNEFF